MPKIIRVGGNLTKLRPK